MCLHLVRRFRGDTFIGSVSKNMTIENPQTKLKLLAKNRVLRASGGGGGGGGVEYKIDHGRKRHRRGSYN